MKTVQQWRTYHGRRIYNIRNEVSHILLQEKLKGHRTSLCIGTDSQVKGAETEFATVIVFVREGTGGFMFINKECSGQLFSIKERMMEEVSKSIAVAYDLMDIADEMNVQMEIHVDINTDRTFRSNEALSEATGYITGMGFQYKLKPHAFASSSCANKMVQ